MACQDSKCEYARPASLFIEELPEEIVCLIIESTIDIKDPGSFTHLAALISSSPRIYEIFRGYRQCILLHLLQNKARELALCFTKPPQELNEIQTQNRWWFLTRLVFYIQRFIYRRHRDDQEHHIFRYRLPADGLTPTSRDFLKSFLRLEVFNLFGRDASGPHRDKTKLWESLPIYAYLSVLRFIRRKIYYHSNALKIDRPLQRRLKTGLLPVYNYRCFTVMHALRGLHIGWRYYHSDENNNMEDIEDFVSENKIWNESGPSFDSGAWTLMFLRWGYA